MAHGVLEPAKVIVAIDFGTTYSGFSYAHMQYAENDADNFIDNVEGFEQWPSQNKAGAKAYCKTQTSLLYAQRASKPGDFELLAWGWTAFHQHLEHLKQQRKLKSPDSEPEGRTLHFIKNFKLALAGPRMHAADSYKLPEGLIVQRVVSDYLQQLSILIEEELQKKYGEHVDKKDIQWCLTVPALWDHVAKQEMKRCAEIAGLVAGPLNVHENASAHPIIIVLEPEAASVYCLHHLQSSHNTDLSPRSKILVVDAGGGTVDLTLHEKLGHGLQVKEISGSSGDLCGATFVDDAFYQFLARKISCYVEFIRENPTAEKMIRQIWEPIKFSFDGSPGPYEFWLPSQLGNYWETYEKARLEESSPETNYDDIKITLEEMRSIFDSAVEKIIELIEGQLDQVQPEEEESISMMVVGGFSGSPYLMNRIRENFESRVKVIINPIHPGKAVVTGAVVYGGLGKEIIVSRIARKTYGVAYNRDFHPNDPESKMIRAEDGRPKCKDAFHIYTRKGNPVPVNYCQKMQYTPFTRGDGDGGPGVYDDVIRVEVYSTFNEDPDFVTDPGCVKECTYSFPIPSREVMKEVPRIEVSMYFGRAAIEVSAVGLNFESEKAILPELTFETLIEVITRSNKSASQRSDPGQQRRILQGNEVLETEIKSLKDAVASLEADNAKLQKYLRTMEIEHGRIPQSGAYRENSATPTHVSEAFTKLSVTVDSFKSRLVKYKLQNHSADNLNEVYSMNYGNVKPLGTNHFPALFLKAEATRCLFKYFDNESFSEAGYCVCPDPTKRRDKFFAWFLRFRNQKGDQDDPEFEQYYRKTKARAWRLFGMQNSGEDLQGLEGLEVAFRRAAENVWSLHLLSFSFEPPASLFRVQGHSAFDKKYMEAPAFLEVAQGSVGEVAFMLTPGLRVDKFSLIKSEIYPIMVEDLQSSMCI